MAHARERQILAPFLKKMKSWPVVSLLGPRQCGKTTFLRDLAFASKDRTFESFDLLSTRRRAETSPELFLKEVEIFPLIIDEVQKVPHIFDEIKAVVDGRRKPGQFVLSGSVQFSRKTGIRESLTGRSATIRMDCMGFLETLNFGTDSGLFEVRRYLEKGGMPGVCFSRDKAVRQDYWEQWLETICERDLKIFGQGRLSGDLARNILENCARLEHPMVSEIARKLRVDSRRIQTHLAALQDLFVVREVGPHEAGTGKPIYYPFDCGLAEFLGAEIRRLWQVWFLVESLTRSQMAGKTANTPRYYLTQRHSFIDFVDDSGFHLFCGGAFPERREKMTLEAAAHKFGQSHFQVYCATESPAAKIGTRQRALPWIATVNRSGP